MLGSLQDQILQHAIVAGGEMNSQLGMHVTFDLGVSPQRVNAVMCASTQRAHAAVIHCLHLVCLFLCSSFIQLGPRTHAAGGDHELAARDGDCEGRLQLHGGLHQQH